ncbi:hypothetical protein C8J57DRAFT_1250597 [Mycena rebaudengoi]|nr:hypothetical protein C8J57DRAFT_1250597 [Mycena rebaudengoi]
MDGPPPSGFLTKSLRPKGKNHWNHPPDFSAHPRAKLFPDLSLCQQALMGCIADRALTNIKNAPVLHGFLTKSLKRKILVHGRQQAFPIYNTLPARKGQHGGIIPEEMLGQVADFCEVLGKKLGIEFEPSKGELELRGAAKIYRDWDELKKLLQEELDRLEELSKAD